MKKNDSITSQPTDFIKPSRELEELQYLMPISDEDKENLEEDIIKSGEVRDPLKVYQDKDGFFYILAGYNRWQIAKANGIKNVPVQIYEGTEQEYKDLVINDNLNRRHLTSDQKRGLINYFLKKNPETSNKQIGRQTGTAKETVQTQREKLESGGEIRPVDKVTGKDGKTYKKPKAKPKPKPKPKEINYKAEIIYKLELFLQESIKKEEAIIDQTLKDSKKRIKAEARRAAFYDIMKYLNEK